MKGARQRRTASGGLSLTAFELRELFSENMNLVEKSIIMTCYQVLNLS